MLNIITKNIIKINKRALKFDFKIYFGHSSSPAWQPANKGKQKAKPIKAKRLNQFS